MTIFLGILVIFIGMFAIGANINGNNPKISLSVLGYCVVLLGLSIIASQIA